MCGVLGSGGESVEFDIEIVVMLLMTGRVIHVGVFELNVCDGSVIAAILIVNSDMCLNWPVESDGTG